MDTDFDAGMNFVSGGDKSFFTKTPANVTAEFFDSPPPTTPKARGGAKKRKIVAPGDDDSDDAPEAKKVRGALGAALAAPKKKRKASGKKNATVRAIPRSWEECDEADQLLVKLRDEGGEWKDIRPKWTEITKEKTAPSTLPNRYARIKSNFTVIDEEDNQRLFEAKREAEDTFEQQKWDLIANMVEASGGQHYMGVVLKRQYKKLMLSVGTMPPEGLEDRDFVIPELESDDDRIGKEESGVAVQEVDADGKETEGGDEGDGDDDDEK